MLVILIADFLKREATQVRADEISQTAIIRGFCPSGTLSFVSEGFGGIGETSMDSLIADRQGRGEQGNNYRQKEE